MKLSTLVLTTVLTFSAATAVEAKPIFHQSWGNVLQHKVRHHRGNRHRQYRQQRRHQSNHHQRRINHHNRRQHRQARPHRPVHHPAYPYRQHVKY